MIESTRQERGCYPNFIWSWLSLDTFRMEIVPWQTLTEGIGLLHHCAKIPAFIFQRRVYLNSGICLSSDKWLLFCDAPPRQFLLVGHMLFLVMITVWWWFPPRCAPGRGLWPSTLVSQWQFWHSFFYWGMLGIPYQPDVIFRCCVEIYVFFFIIVYPFLEGIMFVCSTLWELWSTHSIAFQRRIHPQSYGRWLWSDGCLFACRCESLAWLVYMFDVFFGGYRYL